MVSLDGLNIITTMIYCKYSHYATVQLITITSRYSYKLNVGQDLVKCVQGNQLRPELVSSSNDTPSLPRRHKPLTTARIVWDSEVNGCHTLLCDVINVWRERCYHETSTNWIRPPSHLIKLASRVSHHACKTLALTEFVVPCTLYACCA